MLPKECKMPDLADCQMVRLQGTTILHSFIGNPGVTKTQSDYRRNFARLVDKAIYEYQVARRAVLDEIYAFSYGTEEMFKDGRPLFILGFIDHFENCINAVNRLLKLFERLSNDPLLTKLSKDQKRALASCSRSLPKLRNAVEHVEDLIATNGFAEGQPVVVVINEGGDRAVIGPFEVEFGDVASTLRKLHQIGRMLFDVELTQAPPMGDKSSANLQAISSGEIA